MKTETSAIPKPVQSARFSIGSAPACGEVSFPGASCLDLTQREFALLRYLVTHAGRPVSRDEILCNVWQMDPRQILTRTIDMHVAHLRRKLQDDPARPWRLVTVHGTGYMLVAAQGLSENRKTHLPFATQEREWCSSG